MILDSMGDLEPRPAGPSMYATEKERDQDAQMSAYLREEAIEEGLQTGSQPAKPSPQFSTPRDMTDSNSPGHTVLRQDIKASAEKILYTFLLPGAEREITLPGSITTDVTVAIEEMGRDDPEVFDVAKDYVFQAMERDAFRGFLRMKALGNLIPPTLVMRLIIGLVAMFGAFWTAFVLIFLDKSAETRAWVSGVHACLTCFVHKLTRTRSSSHSPSGYTSSPPTSTRWTPSWRWLVTANIRHSTSHALENPTSASSSSSGRSWSLASPSW